MSSPGATLFAAWQAHGAGTMIEAQVAAPSRIAWNTPTFDAWLAPRSSQERMTSFTSGACPSRSARVVTEWTLTAAGGPETGVVSFRSAGCVGEEFGEGVVGRDRERLGA